MISCNAPIGQSVGERCGDRHGSNGTWQCVDCLRKQRANEEFVSKEKPKFDFENIDVKLFLAMKALLNPFSNASQGQVAEEKAMLAMEEFEQSFGPLPDWAVSRNFAYELVPGAQLCTKDGRRTGNAHIIKIYDMEVPGTADRTNPYGTQTLHDCITDAGSQFTMSEPEILVAFTIGDWISDPKRVLKDFDRYGHYADL